MVYQSQFPPLNIPKVDILTYLFPEGKTPPNKPIWQDADDPVNKHLSSAQLFQWVKRLSLGLDRLRVRHGEVVLICSPNHIFIPVAYLGIVGGSRIFSAVNPAYTLSEVGHQLRNSEAKVILAHPSVLSTVITAAQEIGLSKQKIFQFSDVECPTQHGVKDWRAMLADPADADRYQWKRLAGDEAMKTIATINYSSGTTGLPKGVCISHYNLVANLMQFVATRFPNVVDFEDVESFPEQRWVNFVPLYHATGQMFACLLATKAQIPVWIMPTFDFEKYLAVIQNHRITHLQVVPPVLIMLAKRPETRKYDLNSLEEILCGAAPCSAELQNVISQKFNCVVRQGFGMTELVCSAMSQVHPEDQGTIGTLNPNLEGKLIDDNGDEVGDETPGELYLRGPNTCMGYYKNETATRELFSDGWLKTGDIAVRSREGLFRIVDRKKELIKVNGLQVAPAELEAVLLESDDVGDAAVAAVQISGEEFPRAWVVLNEQSKGQVTEKQIQEWVKTKVAKHKQLTGGVKFVDEVPKLASGKIQRKVIREWAKEDASKCDTWSEGPPLRGKL